MAEIPTRAQLGSEIAHYGRMRFTNRGDGGDGAITRIHEMLDALYAALASAQQDMVTVPELTGCCANCGAKPEITAGPVNDTVCIGLKPTCDCIKRGAPYSSFNLWPAHGVSATLSDLPHDSPNV